MDGLKNEIFGWEVKKKKRKKERFLLFFWRKISQIVVFGVFKYTALLRISAFCLFVYAPFAGKCLVAVSLYFPQSLKLLAMQEEISW